MISRGSVLNGTYEVRGRIGAGGGGVIYLAWHRRLRTDVVIKQLRDGLRDSVDVRAEVDVLKQLRHSFLPQVYDFLALDGSIYTVMEYIPGQNLGEALKRYGPVPEQRLLLWAEQLTDALVYLHGRKPPVIHSDIKPANIMLTPEGSICLIDFNISLTAVSGRRKTIGVSPGFSPPEQYSSLQKYINDADYVHLSLPEGQGVEQLQRDISALIGLGVDERSDLYSLGATLYTLCTGQRPLLQDILFRPANTRNQGISEELSAVIQLLLKIRPEERFQSAAELQYALKHLERYGKAWKERHRRSMVMAAVGAGALVLLGGGALAGVSLKNRNRHVQYESLIQEGLEQRRSDSGEALHLLEQAAELEPAGVDAYLAAMEILEDQYRYEEALTFAAETVLPKASGVTEDGRFNYLLARAYDGTGEEQEAVSYYAAAAEQLPDRITFLQDYIISLIRTGDTAEAELQLARWEAAGGEASLGSYLHAMLALQQGDTEQAEQQALQGLSQVRDRKLEKNLRLFLADLYEQEAAETERAQGDSGADQSEALLEKEIQVLTLSRKSEEGVDPELLERRAMALFQSGRVTGSPERLQEAAEGFEELLRLGMDRVYVYRNIIAVRKLTGETGEAEQILSRMQERWPEDYRTWYESAMLELDIQAAHPAETRDYTAAKQYYEKAASLAENAAEARELLPLAGRFRDLGIDV